MGLTVYGGGGKPEEEKTVTAGTSVMEVNPSSGKVMKKVTVNPTPTESKSVTPTTSVLTVTPSEGKHLSKVVVGAVEDVTPEVTAQIPVITQIAENLGVTITTPSGTNKQILQGNNANLLNIKNNAKKEGAYAWKKLKKSEISITQLTDVNPTILQLSSDDIDLSQCTMADFEWFSGTLTWNGGSAQFRIKNSILYVGTVSFNCTYDPNTQQISVAGTVLGSGLYGEWETQVIKEFVDFLVSDSPNAYPDGGEQGGYWYEKAVKGIVTVSGTFTSSAMISDYSISNPFGSADKIISVLCYCENLSMAWPKVRYKNKLNDTFFTISNSGGVLTTDNMTITDDKISFINGIDSKEYKWEVIGNE